MNPPQNWLDEQVRIALEGAYETDSITIPRPGLSELPEGEAEFWSDDE